MRIEKEKDKIDKAENKILIVFDLENIATLPKADVGLLFYKRKLTMYNLTASTSSKQGYCSILTEMTSGRAGNDTATSFISILKKALVDHPNITDRICCLDSCIPQNRNSHISQAILEFLLHIQTINTITIKYFLCGNVQEADKMHKQIEDAMQVAKFYSPISETETEMNHIVLFK